MRAQFVFENVDFTRGLEPKTAMGIGDPIERITDRVFSQVEKSDHILGFPDVPTKEDVHEWVDLIVSYAGEDDILAETTDDLLNAFREYWEEKQIEKYAS